MFAMCAKARGARLEAVELPTPPVSPDDVRIRVRTTGICHSDVHMIDDDWGMARYPLVPGHEVVGHVVERGARVTHLAVGQRVGVGWQRSACLGCRECLRGHENVCAKSQGVISDGFGGFASELVVDGRFAFALPDALEDHLAGPLMCGGITVFAGLFAGGLRPGQRVGVVGVGGLGHLGVQFAAKLGAEVTVFTTSPDKAELAERLGASDAILVAPDGEMAAPRRPLDLILATAPAAFDLSAYVRALAVDGTLVLVGAPSEPLSFSAGELLTKRRRIMGSVIGSRAEIADMLELAARHGVRPMVEVFPLAEANEAIERVRANRVRYRAVLEVTAAGA